MKIKEKQTVYIEVSWKKKKGLRLHMRGSRLGLLVAVFLLVLLLINTALR